MWNLQTLILPKLSRVVTTRGWGITREGRMREGLSMGTKLQLEKKSSGVKCSFNLYLSNFFLMFYCGKCLVYTKLEKTIE